MINLHVHFTIQNAFFILIMDPELLCSYSIWTMEANDYHTTIRYAEYIATKMPKNIQS